MNVLCAMGKPKKDQIKQSLTWVYLFAAIAAILVLPPTFRSCQLQEQSMQLSRHSESARSSDESASPLKNVITLKPEEIREDVRSRPPLQQEEAINGYKENRVEWLLSFVDAREVARDKIRVTFASPTSSDSYLVMGNVKLIDYPWLKVAHEGTKVQVQGIIQDISSLSIDLEGVQLKLVQSSYD